MALPRKILKQIKKLREHGRSIPEISKELDIARSTVSRHIQGTAIKPEYYERWRERRNASKILSERNWMLARKNAESLVKGLTRRDLMLIGVSLYWAEGAKRDFAFSNTDPEMIRLFVKIIKSVFDVQPSELTVSLRLYEDLDKNKSLVYWSKITGIHLTSRKTSLNILKGLKKGKLKYGMCRIRVRKSGLLLKKIFAIIDKVVEETKPL